MTTSSLPSPLPFRPSRPGKHNPGEHSHGRHSPGRRSRRAKTATGSQPSDPDGVKRLKVDQPEDLLALMPYLLGFQPVESLVMMVIADRLVKVTVRVDLVDDVTGVAQRFGAIAVTNRASGVVLVAYSSDSAKADAMLLPVMERLSSLRVIEAIYTDGKRWWSRSCSDDCCPAEGTPYETGSNRLAAEAVFHGMTSLSDRSELERLTEGPPETDEPELRTLTDQLSRTVLRPGFDERRRLMRDSVADYVARRQRGDRVELADRDLITFALLAMDVRIRDEAWIAITRADAWIHVELWQQVVARTVRDLATPPLCLLGMAAWIEGQGALQVCCLERAMTIDAHYGMVGMLADLNERAVPPTVWDRMKEAFEEAMTRS